MKIDDRIFLETDSSCAYCGVKGSVYLTRHHIDGNKKNNKYENLIVFCYNCHHEITKEGAESRQKIKKMKRLLIYKTLTTWGINAMKIAYRNKGEVVGEEFLLNHLVDMGYLKKIRWQLKGGSRDEADILSVFEITPEGRLLYDNWLK